MYYNDNSFAEGYAIGRDSNGYNNNGMFGDSAWWIIILLIFGWFGNGWGGNGFGGNNGGGFMTGYDLGKVATTNDVASGFNNSAVLSNLNDLKLGQAGIQQTLCQGFNGVNTSILTSTNGTQREIADLGYKLQDCCCKLERGIDGVNFNLSKATCDIIRSGQDNTQRILDFLTNDQIAKLRAENTVLTNQLSQNAQTSTIINTLRPVAQPAYITCSPYESVYGFNRCGCNTGCGI